MTYFTAVPRRTHPVRWIHRAMVKHEYIARVTPRRHASPRHFPYSASYSSIGPAIAQRFDLTVAVPHTAPSAWAFDDVAASTCSGSWGTTGRSSAWRLLSRRSSREHRPARGVDRPDVRVRATRRAATRCRPRSVGVTAHGTHDQRNREPPGAASARVAASVAAVPVRPPSGLPVGADHLPKSADVHPSGSRLPADHDPAGGITRHSGRVQNRKVYLVIQVHDVENDPNIALSWRPRVVKPDIESPLKP